MEDEITAWVLEQARAELMAARHVIESEAAAPEWREQSSGVLWTGPPEHDDTWAGTVPLGDSRVARFIADHDPRAVIARAESVLAQLELHRPVEVNGGWRDWLECRECGPNKSTNGGVLLAPRPGDSLIPCRTVRLLAWGYRHREGWKEEWKP